jgi:hypothetical protein
MSVVANAQSSIRVQAACRTLVPHRLASFSGVPSGTPSTLSFDPVVPGLITGLHHRLGFPAPSGSKFP